MLEIMKHRYEATEGINVVDAMVTRMTDSSLSIFVARNVIEQRDATARLVEAFQALVPEQERRQRLVAMAQEQVEASPLGSEATFPELWKRASEMLTSYSDEPFVSKDYAGELSTARGPCRQRRTHRRQSSGACRGMARNGQRRVNPGIRSATPARPDAD